MHVLHFKHIKLILMSFELRSYLCTYSVVALCNQPGPKGCLFVLSLSRYTGAGAVLTLWSRPCPSRCRPSPSWEAVVPNCRRGAESSTYGSPLHCWTGCSWAPPSSMMPPLYALKERECERKSRRLVLHGHLIASSCSPSCSGRKEGLMSVKDLHARDRVFCSPRHCFAFSCTCKRVYAYVCTPPGFQWYTVVTQDSQ